MTRAGKSRPDNSTSMARVAQVSRADLTIVQIDLWRVSDLMSEEK